MIFRSPGVGKIKKNEKDLKMGCVREGEVRLSVSKVHICYDNTLFSITFEPVVRFWYFNMGFEALNVYFKMELSFYYLVGPLLLESAERRTELLGKWEQNVFSQK